MDKWGVFSEVGRLHTVMVHQPGWEHNRMLPWNREAMLFDDILDIDVAREEHKNFVSILKTQGIEVLHFADLLKDVCADPKRHEEVVLDVIGEEALGGLDPAKIQPTHLLIGYPASYRFDTPTMLEPLLNLYFMRDPAILIDECMVISHPRFSIRQREAKLTRAVFKRHPRFEGLRIYDGILNDPDATLEGGDVLVADEKTVLVGMSERSNDAGAEHLAKHLFEHTGIERLIKIYIPHRHDFMHLDTLLTFVDRQQIITLPHFWDRPDLYAEVAHNVRRQCLRLGFEYTGPDPESLARGCYMEAIFKNGKRETYTNVLAGLANLDVIVPEITIPVGGMALRYATPEEQVQAALREQWNDAANTFALKPGTIVSYSRNEVTRKALESAMVEVIPFIGGELVRGRGGARCMTMPLKREGVKV